MIRSRVTTCLMVAALLVVVRAEAQPVHSQHVFTRFSGMCEDAQGEVTIYGREAVAGNVVRVSGLTIRTNCQQPFQVVYELLKPIGTAINLPHQPPAQRFFFGILVKSGNLDVFFDRNDLADVGLAGLAVSVGITTDTGTIFPYSAVLDPETGELTPVQ